MNAVLVIEQLRSRGVELRFDGERIRFHPANLGEDGLALMRAHRDGIAALLEAERRAFDAPLLHMLHKRDAAVRATDARAASGGQQCHACGQQDWWRNVHHVLPICRICHPSAPGAEAPPGLPIAWDQDGLASVAALRIEDVNPCHRGPEGNKELDAMREERIESGGSDGQA